jgi:hypothetical protein
MIAHRPWLGVSTRDWFINSDTPHPVPPQRPTTDLWRNGPPQLHHLIPGATILRRSEPASRPSPLTRVDLRSSLDPDPSLAYVRTEPEMRRNRSQPRDLRGLTRPRSFRDDLLCELAGRRVSLATEREALRSLLTGAAT